MSEALVNFFLGRLNYLQIQYPLAFAGLDDQILQLKNTLNKISSFIRDVDRAMYGDNSVIQWLRVIISEAEDCVGEMTTQDRSTKAPHYKTQLENISACLSSIFSFRPQLNVLTSEKYDDAQQYSLESSYVSLPNYLRSCLMYICTLPEGYRLREGRLVRLWVAEGLVEDKPGHVVEDIAEEYLKQLVDLGMVETILDYTCHFEYRVPHSFREFLLSEIKEEDFVIAHSDVEPYIYPAVRRVLVYKFANEPNNPLIRSLFTFGLNIDPLDLWPYSWFKLLRVLNLEGLEMKKLGNGVGNLQHLSSLSFRGSELEELPEGISNLCELQTLDIRWCPNISSLPDWILKNAELRNLLMSNNRISGVKLLPRGMERLKNLQSLKGVNAGSYMNARELSFLTQLRELELCNFSEDYSALISSSIMQMRGLLSLNLRNHNFLEDDLLPSLDHIIPPPLLRKLWLHGRLASLPNWINSVKNLARLRLGFSYLSDNPAAVLQFLPNLKHLTLWEAYKAKRIGKEFCQAGGYPKLEVLVYSSSNLVEWTEIQEGSFPCLKYLYFESCHGLLFLPEGLQYVTTLKVLKLCPLHPDHARRLLPDEGKEYYKIKQIPKVDYVLK